MPYDFDEVFLLADVEGRLAEVQLVGQHADRPQVHLLVVPRALQQFWREVEGRAAEGAPEFFLFVDRPAEVAELDVALNPG